MSVVQQYNTHTAGFGWTQRRCVSIAAPIGNVISVRAPNRSRRIRMILNLFCNCHPVCKSILETGTLQQFLAWKLCTGGGGIGVARERDIELLVVAERESAKEMGTH